MSSGRRVSISGEEKRPAIKTDSVNFGLLRKGNHYEVRVDLGSDAVTLKEDLSASNFCPDLTVTVAEGVAVVQLVARAAKTYDEGFTLSDGRVFTVHARVMPKQSGKPMVHEHVICTHHSTTPDDSEVETDWKAELDQNSQDDAVVADGRAGYTLHNVDAENIVKLHKGAICTVYGTESSAAALAIRAILDERKIRFIFVDVETAADAAHTHTELPSVVFHANLMNTQEALVQPTGGALEAVLETRGSRLFHTDDASAATLSMYGAMWCSDTRDAVDVLNAQKPPVPFVWRDSDYFGRPTHIEGNPGGSIPALVFAKTNKLLTEPSAEDILNEL